MVVTKTLLSFFLLAAITSADRVVTVRNAPFSLSISPNFIFNKEGIIDLVQRDRQRVQALAAGFNGDSVSVNSVNPTLSSNQGNMYVAPIYVGDPPTEYRVLVDTGSAFTWIGANKSYYPTNSSTKCPEQFKINYGVGGVEGNTYNDSLTIAEGLTVQYHIGVASQTSNLSYDGILGLGPTDLNSQVFQLPSGGVAPAPSVLDALIQQGKITTPSFGISFAPLHLTTPNPLGAITWGECDTTEKLTTVDVTKTPVSSHYWGINQTITYGDISILSSAGFLDTGTTLIMLAPAALQKYINATGALWDEEVPLLKIRSNQFSKLKSLNFTIGDTTFEFIANAQILPTGICKFSGISDCTDTDLFLTVNSFPAGVNIPGVDFVNGYFWLERFYTCYDSEKKQVNIAPTKYTFELPS